MARVPIDADPHQRAWQQLLHHVGLAESTPMPVRRVASAGVGISAAIGSEVNPPPRPKPPIEHMRGEGGAPPRSLAERVWPGLRRREK
jgi:hypothetical protein